MLNIKHFVITVEVVPPAGPDSAPLLASLKPLAPLPIDAFSVATNPVAKPRMSAMALCHLIQRGTGRPAVLHLTTRDHNRLSLQALLWGAKALGIETVLAASGDFVALEERRRTTTVRDLSVFDLIQMARENGFQTGVVFDPHWEQDGLDEAVQRLMKKAASGAQFAVTQPVYDADGVNRLQTVLAGIGMPVLMGILPLRSPRHAEFLHTRVAGISVPAVLRGRMHRAADPAAEGIANASDMLAAARRTFAGACIMPPFDHYEDLEKILSRS